MVKGRVRCSEIILYHFVLLQMSEGLLTRLARPQHQLAVQLAIRTPMTWLGQVLG